MHNVKKWSNIIHEGCNLLDVSSIVVFIDNFEHIQGENQDINLVFLFIT